MATVHDAPVEVEAEVARAARLLLDLDRFSDRVRGRDPDGSRAAVLEARLDALRRLIGRLAGPLG